MHFHSSVGLYGPERWTHLVVSHADPRRLAIEVLTIGTKPGYDDFSTFLRQEGFAATHLPIGGHVRPSAVRSIRRLLLEHEIDVLHTHGFKTDVLGYLATRGTSVSLVTTPHGWCDHEGLRIRIYEAIGRAFLYGFDGIYPVSEHQGALLRRRPGLGRRVQVMHNAVDISRFDPVFRDRRRSRHAGEPFHLLFVGRVVKEKGIFDLVRALALLGRAAAPTYLTVVGNGEARDEAEARAAALGVYDCITFAGTQDDVRPFLRQADAFVLPSYSEGVPRALMEAFAAGVAVIGSDIPGVREIVEPGATGVVVPPGDPSCLAGAIEMLRDHPEMGWSMAQRARRYVETAHAPARLVREVEQAYLALPRPADRKRP